MNFQRLNELKRNICLVCVCLGEDIDFYNVSSDDSVCPSNSSVLWLGYVNDTSDNSVFMCVYGYSSVHFCCVYVCSVVCLLSCVNGYLLCVFVCMGICFVYMYCVYENMTCILALCVYMQMVYIVYTHYCTGATLLQTINLLSNQTLCYTVYLHYWCCISHSFSLI